MGTPKGHEKRGDERPEAERESAVPHAQDGRGRRGRGRSRRRGRASTPGEEARSTAAVMESEHSGEHNVAVGFVELSAAAPMAVEGESANSNHRADIVLSRALAEQPAPEAAGHKSKADEAYRRRREDDTTATVLDAPYSMHTSAPPAPRPSWALRLWVTLMCGIIAAAGVVAWKNHKGGGAAPQASASEEPVGAASGGGAPQSPDVVPTERASAAATVLSPVVADAGRAAAAGDQAGDTQATSESGGESQTEEAEAKPTRSRARRSAAEPAASGEGEAGAVTQGPAAAPAEQTPRDGFGAPPEARLGGLPPGSPGGAVSSRTEPVQAPGASREAAGPASGEVATQADAARTRRQVDTASLPQLPQNPYETDTP